MVRKKYQSIGDAAARYEFYRRGAEGLDDKAIRSYNIAAQYEEGSPDWKKNIEQGDHFRERARRFMHTAVRFKRIAEGGKPFRGLEKATTAAAAIIGLFGGILFLSNGITGNVIGNFTNMTNSTMNWIGGVLFAVGLVGAFMYFRRR